MPKSKRNKVVNLTKAKKKDRTWKEGLISQVRSAAEEYPSVLLFRYHNMRNELFKELREELKDSSRFVMGSNKMLQVALGKTPADELRLNLSLLSARLAGHVGLMFTRLAKDEAVSALEEVQHEDYARAGSAATAEFSLPAGPLSNAAGPLPHTLEPSLRKHGLPTRLNKGVVELLADHTVCRKGQALSPDQVALLRAFGVRMATFRLSPLAWWGNEGDDFEELAADGDGDEEEDGGDEPPQLAGGGMEEGDDSE